MPTLPPYFDALIAARRSGHVGRHVHLGYWDQPPALTEPCRDGEFESAQARLAARLIDLAPLSSGQAVLDVACGFGGTLAAIDARLARMRLTGLNIDRRQLSLCGGTVTGPGNTLGLVAADACALPFRSAVFDHVFCVEAMFHFTSRQQFLAEAGRVVRPGGHLVVSDILLRQPASGAPWDTGVIAAIIRRDYGPWPAPWSELSEILLWAHQAGLEQINARDWSAATLPSYRTVAPEEWSATRRQPSAGDVFRWLHTRGWLTYAALSFRRR